MRNYNITICDSRVLIDSTTTLGQRRVIEVGGLGTVVSWNDKPIWKVARHMRIRPEAVFQMLSDAFDDSLTNGTMLVEDGCLRFESDIATIILDPGEDGLSWELKYKAKETMYCKDIRRHPKEVFTVPENLSKGNAFFPDYALHHLVSLAEDLSEPPSVELLDKLNRDYHRALREKTFTYDEDTLTLTFKTQFWTQVGQQIYATIEPHYYDPIPNTWRLSRFWCTEDQE